MHAPDRHELNNGWILPGAYGVDRLVLMPKDPHTLFAYWELTPQLESAMLQQYAESWDAGRQVLRVYNTDRSCFMDLEINGYADNWYIQVENADSAYFAEMGRILPDGTFVPVLTSNTVRTPRDCISSVIDPRWKMFAFWQHRYDRNFSYARGGDSSYSWQTSPSPSEMFAGNGTTGEELE